jgi:hypothetical protein
METGDKEWRCGSKLGHGVHGHGTACTVAVLYDGDERPVMVVVVAIVRGGGGGVLHSAFDRTNSRERRHGRELGSSTIAASATASLE